MPSPTTTLDGTERVRYFSRQLITADDMRAEQEYLLNRMRRHNRMLHGAGVVCGLAVIASPSATQPWRVAVSAGYALTPRGDEVCVAAPGSHDLAECGRDAESACTPTTMSSVVAAGQAPTDLFVGIRYEECPSRPVRVMPAGCGCGDSSCDYSRTRDEWRLGCWPVPANWTPDPVAGSCAAIAERLVTCAEQSTSPWVILARVTFSGGGIKTLDNSVRRWLYSTAALQGVCCRDE